MLRSFLRIGIGSAQRKTANPSRGVVHPGEQRVECSGGQPLVTVMQTANLWEGNNLSRFSRLDRPAGGRVLFQREVRAGAMVVVDIRRQYSPQVPFVEDDDMIKALSPNRPYHPLDKRVLPGRAQRRHYFLDVHGLDLGTDCRSVDAIPISDHVSRGGVPGECLGDLLCHPVGSRVRRHAEVHNPPALVAKYDNNEENAERGCGQDEEID